MHPIIVLPIFAHTIFVRPIFVALYVYVPKNASSYNWFLTMTMTMASYGMGWLRFSDQDNHQHHDCHHHITNTTTNYFLEGIGRQFQKRTDDF